MQPAQQRPINAAKTNHGQDDARPLSAGDSGRIVSSWRRASLLVRDGRPMHIRSRWKMVLHLSPTLGYISFKVVNNSKCVYNIETKSRPRPSPRFLIWPDRKEQGHEACGFSRRSSFHCLQFLVPSSTPIHPRHSIRSAILARQLPCRRNSAHHAPMLTAVH